MKTPTALTSFSCNLVLGKGFPRWVLVASVAFALGIGLPKGETDSTQSAPSQTQAHSPAQPSAPKGRSCEELKSTIEAKLKAKGVAHFTLEIVAADHESQGKIVGHCEAGSKRIWYNRK